jgi:CheY-like chemotaxis protein
VVIDDNRDAADMLALLVESLGGSARAAYDAPSGLSLIETFAPDVVLLDIGMASVDGYETCRRIRARQRGPITVVAVTGWGQDADKQRARDAGFDAHLTKPVDLSRIRELLASSQSRVWARRLARENT